MAPTRVALCVDDFGLHDGVDDAVFALAALDRVNAVGCMVGGPAWRGDATRLARLDRGRLDIGLHLDLTERPLNPALRAPLSGWIARCWLRQVDRAALAAEIRDQLDAFEQALGHRPDYVDGHQHVHQFPVVRDLLLDALVARCAGSAELPWLRCTRRRALPASPSTALGWRERFVKPWLIETLGAHALEQQARRRGHATNRRLLGVHDFHADAAGYRRMLVGWLRAACDGDLLMCHPSLPRAVDDPLLGARCSEYAVLAGADFAALLEAEDVRLEPVSRIRAPAAD